MFTHNHGFTPSDDFLYLQKERVTFGRSYSDEECEDELVPIATKSAASSMQKLAPKVKKKVK